MAGNFDINPDNDDDDDSDDGIIDDPFYGRFRPIPPGVLTIESILMDDMYSGVASKMRFRRIPEHENLKFILNSEIHFLVNSFAIPYLRELIYDSDHCE